jgi:hypothetical protein
MSVSYDRKKIDEFNKLLAEFNSAKSIFSQQYTDFTDMLDTVIRNYQNEASSSSAGYTFYKGSSGNYYILTPSKILMKTSEIPDTASNIDDSTFEEETIVTVESNKVFYSKIKFSGKLTNDNIVDNKYLQVGLDKLNATPNDYDKDYEGAYEVSQSQSPALISSGECDGSFYEKCDSYAKMTNKPYYGIGYNNSDDCTCYTFDNDQKINNLTNLTTEILNIDVTEALFGHGFNMPLSYFGIMMDGGLYGIKSPSFSDNYDKAYEQNSNSHALVNMNTDYTLSGCNMYTGSGPHSIKINSLGEDICTKK